MTVLTHAKWCAAQRECIKPGLKPCYQCKAAYESAQAQATADNSAMDAIAAIERRYAKYVANEECCALRSELRELLQQHQ